MAITLGVVLAGGAGARLGAGLPKPLRVIGGMTLLDRAVGILRGVADDVVVVAPAERVLPACGARRVHDASGAAGPLAGVVGGLSARPHDRALVLGVDFPLMRIETLRALLELLCGGPHVAVVPVPGGVPQPLAAAYAFAVTPRFVRALAAGERSAIAAVAALDPLWLDDAAIEAVGGQRLDFFNVNEPDDLVEAERVLAERARMEAV